jgi:cytoskeletal protein CcmA (bactofilin family)
MPDSDMEIRKPPLPARRREEMKLTVISEGDVMVGRLSMAGNGQLLGSFDGDVTCPGELLVGADATVRADVEAQDLIVAGHIHGNVVVRGRLKITTTGRLDGDAHVGSLVVQEGGVHFGLLHVYPDGLPERPLERVAELALVNRRPEDGGSRTRPLAASVERVKKMWGEIF